MVPLICTLATSLNSPAGSSPIFQGWERAAARTYSGVIGEREVDEVVEVDVDVEGEDEHDT